MIFRRDRVAAREKQKLLHRHFVSYTPLTSHFLGRIAEAILNRNFAGRRILRSVSGRRSTASMALTVAWHNRWKRKFFKKPVACRSVFLVQVLYLDGDFRLLGFHPTAG
jgi:hypothetical protein